MLLYQIAGQLESGRTVLGELHYFIMVGASIIIIFIF
jgi:hypothetical protein